MIDVRNIASFSALVAMLEGSKFESFSEGDDSVGQSHLFDVEIHLIISYK